MKRLLVCILALALAGAGTSQSAISITIDDVPHIKNYKKNGFESGLLKVLDSLQIPIAIFINEGRLDATPEIDANLKLLEQWIKRSYITLGNHTLEHSRYSKVGFEAFSKDVLLGEEQSKPLAQKHDKSISYFRFPYNDLGADSISHVQMDTWLKDQGYYPAPFTFESSDWMFSYLYDYYLKQGNTRDAKRIAKTYLATTYQQIAFFDSLSIAHFNRKIPQIYLCHDNRLNADYLTEMVTYLSQEGHTFISMPEALEDPAYSLPTNYYKKWGISWFYRWMKDPDARQKLMRAEPDIKPIIKEYERLSK